MSFVDSADRWCEGAMILMLCILGLTILGLFILLFVEIVNLIVSLNLIEALVVSMGVIILIMVPYHIGQMTK